MNSHFESAKHREIHATREAIRAHAIDQNNTGRAPQRVIEILAGHGCTHPGLLLSDLLIGNLSAGDRRLLRKISASSVPPVTPIQKPEEPKRVVKYTPPALGTLEDYYLNRRRLYW